MFDPCCCTVPRSVLNARKSLTKTSASWEEIRRIETVKICRDTKITFGSQLIQVFIWLCLWLKFPHERLWHESSRTRCVIVYEIS